MIEQILYHGTEKDRAFRMLEQGQMEMSRGDRHWLGDGSYFFEDDFFAYKWIFDMHYNRQRMGTLRGGELLQFYSVIQGKLTVSPKRIFNLDTFRHKIEFDRVCAKCEELKSYSEKFSATNIVDGVILNIMFNEMGYDQYFDVVMCTFRQRSHKYLRTATRIGYIPQKQICIKKGACITLLGFFDCSAKTQEYQSLLIEYNKGTDKKNPNKYCSTKRKMY